ncbi:alpha/beta hydrolase [Flagellimonas sp. S174]|uniref:alpha/beta hydrolase n=1 Tax=Flagellimonas sp. S174 TaxID=3410790 RepID=UPI003BF607B2
MKKNFFLVFAFIGLAGYAQKYTDTDTISVKSNILDEDITVITYNANISINNTPFIYITDGQKMIENGTLSTIKSLGQAGKTKEAMYIFISTIDQKTQEDRRDTYFFCNEDYVRFFEEELVPRVEGSMNRKIVPAQRSLVGISFGGLNAAYFSGKTDLFGNYALLSPITYPCQDFMKGIAFSENKDLRILLTSGTNDAENYMAPLLNMYKGKGYEVESFTTEGAHDFGNWNGQLERVLTFLLN